jgi:C-terminal processing protease CtpA/Prc
MLASPNPQPPAKNPRFGLYAVMLLLSVTTFFIGWQLGQRDTISAGPQEASLWSLLAPTPEQPDSIELTEVWRVWDILEDKFAIASGTEPVTDESRVEGMIQGLVRSYDDPYTTYLPPDDAEQFSEDISGNFGGVGMEVGMRNDVITIIAPLPDTPAERAGLLAGDIIVEIDEESTEGMSVDRAVQLIRGEPGTDVALTIFRSGASDFQTISVTRDTITIPTIETEQRGNVFIIQLYSFNALAESEMQLALREFNGSSLKVTIARWLTPDGTSISDGGLEPDYVIERSVEQILADEDPQLEAALRYLAGDSIGTSTATTTALFQ